MSPEAALTQNCVEIFNELVLKIDENIIEINLQKKCLRKLHVNIMKAY